MRDSAERAGFALVETMFEDEFFVGMRLVKGRG